MRAMATKASDQPQPNQPQPAPGSPDPQRPPDQPRPDTEDQPRRGDEMNDAARQALAEQEQARNR